MKKILLVIGLILFLTIPALAQNRGLLANHFASWYTVGLAQTTVTFPYKSRDIAVHNGDPSESIFLDLSGGTIPAVSWVENSVYNPSILKLEPQTALSLTDFPTTSISFRTFTTATASPVSVIVTY